MFKNYLQNLEKILKINTEQAPPAENAPFGIGNAECLAETLSIAENMGFKTRNNGGFYGIATVGVGERFGILGHLDTVPISGGWTKNPLGELTDTHIYGRGVLDNKGPMLACLFATKQLLDEGYTPSKQIEFIFGCNEESGWKCIDKYLEDETPPPLAFSPDGDFPVIHLEKGIVYFEVTLDLPSPLVSIVGGSRPNMVMDKVEATLAPAHSDFDAKASALLLEKGGIKTENKLCFLGKSAHGSTPSHGKNAFFKLLEFLSETYGGEWTSLAKKLTNNDGSGLGIDAHDNSGSTTVNLGKIYSEGGKMSFTLDIRYPMGVEKQTVIDKVTLAFNSASVTEIASHPLLYFDESDPLIEILLDCYNTVRGENARPLAIGGATYARALPHAVAFGPMFPEMESTIHQADEGASLDDLAQMYAIYYQAIKRICFQ